MIKDMDESLREKRDKLYAEQMLRIVEYMRKNPRWKLYMNDFTDILTRIHDIATRFDGVGHVK
tara:strand:- start:207 stop:395 length:189 start_codon:yes stop_codon:yes gene_type:complete